MPYLRDFSLLFWYNESIKIYAVFPMMTQYADKKREQIQMFCMDDLVPQDHLLRLIDQTIDWSFIYELVIDKYSADNGRPSMDPVMLIKIPFIQYLYGIRSMRKTVKEIEVNVAYRWFLGLEMMDKVPHFSTFGKNYTQMIGKARMEMKVGLTFACMNLKKLAKMIARKGNRGAQKCLLLIKYTLFEPKTRKTLLEC